MGIIIAVYTIYSKPTEISSREDIHDPIEYDCFYSWEKRACARKIRLLEEIRDQLIEINAKMGEGSGKPPVVLNSAPGSET